MAQGNYNEPFFWHRIVNVGWAGGIVVLEVEGPNGIDLNFPDRFEGARSASPFTRQNLTVAITEIIFSESSVIGTLYDVTEPWYSINSVVFPDSPIFNPPNPSYEDYKANFIPPEGRFEEITDLRLLGTDVTHVATIASEGSGGWPLNGEWATWGTDAPNPPTAAGWYGRWSDGRAGYLPPSSGSDPSAPGYTVEPFWGLGENHVDREFSHDKIRKIWLLDFGPARTIDGFPIETLIGQTVNVVSIDAGHDDRLGASTTTIRLKVYGQTATFTIAGNTLTASVSPSKTETMTVAYDQENTFQVNANGFV